MQFPKFKNTGNRNLTAKAQPAQDGLANFFAKIFGLPANWYKERDIFKNNFEMGVRQFRQGNIQDAIFRFRIVTWLNPKHTQSWYWLGRSYLRNKDHALAAKALHKASKLNPGEVHINYMLAVALGKKAPQNILPKAIPLDIVKEHFNMVASRYDAAIKAEQRTEHNEVASAARAAAQQGRIDHVVLDLGAGTGLCGSQLKDISSQMVGVDFAEKMVERAKALQNEDGKKTYSVLVEKECIEYLKDTADSSFSIILASGLVHYMGDLQPLVNEVARVLKPGGIFVFSALAAEDNQDHFNAEKEMFAFTKNYLESLQGGFSATSVKDINLAPAEKGWLGVFTK